MKRWQIVLAAFVVLLVGVGLALPSIIKKVVESKQANMPGGYHAKLDHVEIRGFGSEIALCGFKVSKKNGLPPVPFMQAKEFDLIIERDGWKLRSVMRYVEPVISFVSSESEAKKQTGPKDYIQQVRGQLPFELTRVEVLDGTIHFHNYESKPPVDLYARNLNLRWDHLYGCLPPGNSACRSQLNGTLNVMKSGSVKVRGRFARTPVNEFHVTAHLRNLRAVELNAFLNEYVKIKASNGVIALDARYDRTGERHDALLVPLLDDIEVEKAEGEDKSFLRKVGAGIATGWFERKKGKKGIAITKKANGATDFEIVDKPDVDDAKDARAD